MDASETAPSAAIKMSKPPYIPHELVSVIMARLPVESLVRFSSVCKAWRSTISGDAHFHRAHLRLQKPFLLVSRQAYQDSGLHKDKVIFYRWDDNLQVGTAPLVHATDMSSNERVHGFVHCDGLILLPAEDTVRVLNPATHRTLTLPWSPGVEPPCQEQFHTYHVSHQAFGFGHDPRSDVYKVARFFYRTMYAPTRTDGHNYTTGMEVFTIGRDQHWRDIAEHPLYPVLTRQRQPAAFFKGSLVWTIDESILGHVAPGFLCFSLEDETFRVMSTPTCYRKLEHAFSVLAELRGELCLARQGADIYTLEMWMCSNIGNAKWDQRYKMKVSTHTPLHFKPIAILDDEIVFKERYHTTIRYDLKTKAYKKVFHMEELRYNDPNGYRRRRFAYFDVIPYTPSLIQV